MAINEWYEDALRRKKSEIMAETVVNAAYHQMILRDRIDVALDDRDEEAFYILTNELKGMEQ
jgi:uncharacterized protein YpiB (UPF0302 family)